MQFNVSFKSTDMKMHIKHFQENDMLLNVRFSNLQRITEYQDAPIYTGSYEITPRVDAQVLPTAQKLMTDDLTVCKIPYFETSNKDGETVYIGMEVDIYGD